MKICVAGQGAFGQKHLDALKRISGVEVVSLIGGNPAGTEQVAKKYAIPHWGNDLAEGIKRADAVILATPTKMHFKQAEQVMRAGKHVLVEIPVTDSVQDAEGLVKIARETGVTAMGGHVRRFNPSHQWVHKRIEKGELKIQQMDVQTYFFRRKNINAAGNARSWTDHLLWHHAAHTIGLILEQGDGVGGVMPQQVVGPAARVARRVDVLAAEKIGLHVHLLDLELTLLDALVNPLVARVEAAHVPAHRDDAGLLGDLHQVLGVFDAVGDRDLDQNMFAGAHHLLALPKMHLGR